MHNLSPIAGYAVSLIAIIFMFLQNRGIKALEELKKTDGKIIDAQARKIEAQRDMIREMKKENLILELHIRTLKEELEELKKHENLYIRANHRDPGLQEKIQSCRS